MTSVALPPFAIAAISATAPVPSSLQPGAVLSAQVLARLDDVTLRILLGGETIDFKTDRPLAPGTPVELVVGGTQSHPEITLRALPENSRQTDSRGIEVADVAQSPSPRTPALESAVKTVAAFVGDTAVRQGGLAPLYANLESALARLDLSIPQPVAAAARQLLSLRLEPDDDGNVDVAEVKSALQRSGLVTESNRPAGSQPLRADLRGALQALRESLKAWADTEPLPTRAGASPQREPAPPRIQSDVPTPSRLFGPLPPIQTSPLFAGAARLPSDQIGAQQADQPVPRQLIDLGQRAPSLRPDIAVAGEADAAVNDVRTALQRSGLVPDPDGSRGARPSPGQADLRAALQALRETLQRWTDPEPLPLQRDVRQPPLRWIEQPAEPSRAAAPVPPFRNTPTVPQAPVPASVQADASSVEVMHQLLQETDAAIARHTLLQIASLPDDQGGGTRASGDASTHLTFDIPLAVGQGTAVAQLRIEHDGAEQRADGVEPVWRVSFSIDLEPIGPVHARISLTGDRAAVILRAERSESAERLAQELPLLEAGLRRAELEPGTLLCRMGAPEAPPAAAGQFLDHAT